MSIDEIIQALKHCADKDFKCEKCSLYDEDDAFTCSSKLKLEALELINRQQADNERLKKLLEEANKSLEKQIPKEPIGIDWLYCPNCRNSLDVLNLKKHCDECGQALDWSETE